MANVEKLMANVESRMVESSKQKKNYKVYQFKEFSTPYIILYPLMILCWGWNKLIEKVHSYCKWNEKRANRIITQEIIRRGELKKGVIHYYWRTWGNWWYDKYHCRLRDRMFCRKFNEKITDYFVHEYVLNKYTKEVEFEEGWYNFTFMRLEEQ